ncbi:MULTISPECIES: hypothetical protein [unclassified Nostoc]|uniref:hypothetical protein n=1 Tax=unclassified Nostoc TaxID=2593658 RepID=UPI0013D4C772|nr:MULTISPECIES: hypothetical protein [unclassified Nostoc]MBE9000643.1 hypothetical protein [Nostoc sp. LEGE 12447]NEU79020.1 hypothetical protein [Nostoc sp. UIC 10630]
MKNKFLALAAFGTAILGGAILSAPVNAQIAPGSQTQPITVNVSVPEILFLRTITTADVAITPTDLVGAAGAALLTSNGGTPAAYEGSGQSAGSTLDIVSPFTVAAAPVLKTIPSAYIVWSNSPTGSYEVDITPGPFVSGANNLAVVVNGGDVSTASITAEGLTAATPKDIALDVTLNATAPAGTYTGVLTVDAFRP